MIHLILHLSTWNSTTSTSLNNIILADDQIVFCVSKDHPLAQKESVTTQEMSKEKADFFLMYGLGAEPAFEASL